MNANAVRRTNGPRETRRSRLPLARLRPFRTAAMRRAWLATATIVVVGAVALVAGPAALLTAPFLLAVVAALAIALAVSRAAAEHRARRLSALLEDERVLSSAMSVRLREHSSLEAVGRAIDAALDLDHLLEVVLSAAVEHLEGSGGAVLLLEGPDLRGVSARAGEPARPVRLRASEGPEGRVAATREPFLDPGTPGQTRSALYVPLHAGEEPVGVLRVDGSDERPYTDYDLRSLTIFGESVGPAVANSVLYQTERVRVRELLEAYRLKGELISAMGQELRTPLTSILASIITLRELDLDRDQRNGVLDVIERQSNKLLDMVERVAGGREPDRRGSGPQAVDLGALVARVANGFTGRGQPVALSAESGCVVHGDEEVLTRVVSSVVDDALRQGFPPVRVDVAQADGQVIVSVVDSNRGGTPEERERDFGRATGNGARPAQGGQGLSIVRAVLAALRGSVTVERAPEGGIAVRIVLPAHADERVSG